MPNIAYGSPTVSGSVDVTATVTQTKRNVLYLWGQTTGTNALGTVPTGKIWRIVGVQLSMPSATSGAHTLSLNVAGTVILLCQLNGLATYGNGDSHITQTFSYENAINATAGQAVNFVNNEASGLATAGVWYIEESE